MQCLQGSLDTSYACQIKDMPRIGLIKRKSKQRKITDNMAQRIEEGSLALIDVGWKCIAKAATYSKTRKSSEADGITFYNVK